MDKHITVSVQYGGKKGRSYPLRTSEYLVAVRTHSRNLILEAASAGRISVSRKSRQLLGQFESVARFRRAGVEVLRVREPQKYPHLRDQARALLQKQPGIRFAGRVLCDPRNPQSASPVVYTENFFVKFQDDRKTSRCRKALQDQGLRIRREIEYLPNAFFVSAAEGAGLAKVFELGQVLLKQNEVEFCHPELVRPIRRRRAFAPQWHLKKTRVNGEWIDAHASVEAAWRWTQGEGTIIAIIDDGVDIDHPEFRGPGKIVAPWDAVFGSSDPRPGNEDDHGTACAGVACANGDFGASGVAPRARLMPIRLVADLGAQNEADAFVWAAQNGADVLSCSWGPEDGDWSKPSDPLHRQKHPLPDSTRLAIDWAVQNGRHGRGCVITFAAGNGNESVDNDGYASYEKVIAVAACNEESKKSVYSDYGKAIWCAFPSSHGDDPSKTPGIWTTDRAGRSGYNPGLAELGDAAGDFTNDFGGTSSACPGVAGVAALILARNPNLRWEEVREILRRSCDPIDPKGGKYDEQGHSKKYGYGRVNAKKAVELAAPPIPRQSVVRTVVKNVPIRDLQSARLALTVPDTSPPKAVRITVDIEHTYIGDLVVTVQPPEGVSAAPLLLHNRERGGARDLRQTFDATIRPDLAALAGQVPQGEWTLAVEDQEREDTGRIRRFSLEFWY